MNTPPGSLTANNDGKGRRSGFLFWVLVDFQVGSRVYFDCYGNDYFVKASCTVWQLKNPSGAPFKVTFNSITPLQFLVMKHRTSHLIRSKCDSKVGH